MDGLQKIETRYFFFFFPNPFSGSGTPRAIAMASSVDTRLNLCLPGMTTTAGPFLHMPRHLQPITCESAPHAPAMVSKIPRLPLFGHFLPRVQTRIFRFIA